MTLTYLGLGGNICNTKSILLNAIEQIKNIPCISNLKASKFYLTTPVSAIPQAPYLNAACCFHTTLSANELLLRLKHIEISLGKTRKAKNAPRAIDLDILFFGRQVYNDEELVIPHPRWQERLFVLVPLADLTDAIDVPSPSGSTCFNIRECLKTFSNPHNEVVSLME